MVRVQVVGVRGSGEIRVFRFASVLAAAFAASAAGPCVSAEALPGDAPLVGVAGVPRELGATRDYDRIFGLLARHGIGLFYPVFQYVEAPRSASLGFETDFVPPCRPDDPAFAAMRAHGVQLIVPAGLLYDRAMPLPPIDRDPLAELIACAGRDTIFGVLSYDEPAHAGVPPQATEALYARVKAVAKDMPVLMVHAPLRIQGDAPSEDPARLDYLAEVAEHSRHADIVGFDTYPIPTSIARVGAPDAGDRIMDEKTAVETYLEFIKRAAPGKRYLSVLQNFSPADQYAPALLALVPPHLRAEARAPSRSEMATMLHEAVEHGASVVVWYGAGFTKTMDAPQWRGTLDLSARLGSR